MQYNSVTQRLVHRYLDFYEKYLGTNRASLLVPSWLGHSIHLILFPLVIVTCLIWKGLFFVSIFFSFGLDVLWVYLDREGLAGLKVLLLIILLNFLPIYLFYLKAKLR